MMFTAARKLLSRLLAGLGLAWLILTFTPVVLWWAQWLSAGYSEEPRPVLIVLAGDRLNDTTVGYSTYLRCVYTAHFWQQNHPAEIILSGGPMTQPTAALMADLIASLGVPRTVLRLETRSENTRQNLQETAAMLAGDSRPATLLTSDFHMRRALLLARAHHLLVVPYPVPDVLKRATANMWERPGLVVLLMGETGKLSWEAVRGGL
jgi:uncharacterized SAM-binding protein YcdF (DUF218 family)